MVANRRSAFVRGFAAGALGTLVATMVLLYLLSMLDLVAFSLIGVPRFQQLLAWSYRNLGLSLIPFSLTLALYAHSLQRLRVRVRDERPLEQVAQAEHLTDIWISLFFGIGVIWTAIGMRNALLYALGDPADVVQQGAFAILQRLVDGGILIALSTTIFGGVGGYLMRVVKTLSTGAEIKRYYNRRRDAPTAAIQSSLAAIEAHLERLAPPQPEPRP